MLMEVKTIIIYICYVFYNFESKNHCSPKILTLNYMIYVKWSSMPIFACVTILITYTTDKYNMILATLLQANLLQININFVTVMSILNYYDMMIFNLIFNAKLI